MLLRFNEKIWRCSLILLLSASFVVPADIAIRGYQLLPSFEGSQDSDDKARLVQQSLLAQTPRSPLKSGQVHLLNEFNREKPRDEHQSRVEYVEDYGDPEDEEEEETTVEKGRRDSKMNITSSLTPMEPYNRDAVDFEDMYMNYYNKQPKRSVRHSRTQRGLSYPMYDGSSSLDDFTKDEIIEYLDYDEYRRMMESNNNRVRRCTVQKSASAEVKSNSSGKLTNKFDSLYTEIAHDIKKITELESEIAMVKGAVEQKRSAPAEVKTSKICCNPEKPSIVLDSSSSPSQVVHIDRNTVEEIIQVDIPRNGTRKSPSLAEPICKVKSNDINKGKVSVTTLHK